MTLPLSGEENNERKTSMKIISIQPGQTTDPNAEYDPRKPLPYPYHIEPGGDVARQDFWRGSPSRLLGFQRGSEQRVVLTTEVFEADPQQAVGLCPVFMDEQNQFAKAMLRKGNHGSPSMWADTRPIIRVQVTE